MENQHKKISGYRELTQEEIDLMNRIKAFGPELDKLCMDIHSYLDDQYEKAERSRNADELVRLGNAAPQTWRAEGMRDLQKGLMFLTRSVAQPTFF